MFDMPPPTRPERIRNDVTAAFLAAGLLSGVVLTHVPDCSLKENAGISLLLAFVAGGVTRGAHAINSAVTDARETKEAQRRSRERQQQALKNG